MITRFFSLYRAIFFNVSEHEGRSLNTTLWAEILIHYYVARYEEQVFFMFYKLSIILSLQMLIEFTCSIYIINRIFLLTFLVPAGLTWKKTCHYSEFLRNISKQNKNKHQHFKVLPARIGNKFQVFWNLFLLKCSLFGER